MSNTVPLRIESREVRAVDCSRSTTVNAIDRSLEWLGLVARAFGRCGLTHKAAAITMEIDPGQLSAQLAGAPQKHLSFRKLGMLPPEFWVEMLKLVCEFHGIQPPGVSARDRELMEIGKLEVEKQRLIAGTVAR